ncbi:hypothetical protein J4436_01745 [Candidatus Woesearchaeota archaeon]|nr:hypothetical protein [Candidatus Woesearchaeota archaeon]
MKSNIIIGMLIIAVISTLILVFDTESNEKFTELYFENHKDLPNLVKEDRNYGFSFTIHNLELEEMVYEYQVLMKYNNKEIQLNNGVVVLDNGESETVQNVFTVKDFFKRGKIEVKLTNNEEIYFWIKQEEG